MYSTALRVSVGNTSTASNLGAARRPVANHFFWTVGVSVKRSFSMNANGGMSSEALMPK